MLSGLMKDSAAYVTVLLGSAAVGFLGSYFVAGQLLRLKAFQPYREQGPKRHFLKGSVPTGGGIVFIIGLIVFWFIQLSLWFNMNMVGSPMGDRSFAILTIVVGGAVLIGLIGLVDDLMKLYSKATIGLPARYKFLLQLLVGAIASYLLTPESSRLVLPLGGMSRELFLPLSIVLGTVFFAGIINGVNFTDGLDGLASGCVIVSLIALNLIYALHGITHLSTLAVVAMGLTLGFFVVNLKPAFIYMGDTGSYTLGALLALLTIAGGLHLFILLFGIVYVVEALSVILQVASFRLYGRRIFRMAPIHHHFEILGWREESIVVRFWLVQAAAAAIAVALAL